MKVKSLLIVLCVMSTLINIASCDTLKKNSQSEKMDSMYLGEKDKVHYLKIEKKPASNEFRKVQPKIMSDYEASFSLTDCKNCDFDPA